MSDTSHMVTAALDLMDRALVLLDDAGQQHAALRLQHAIEIARDIPIPRSAAEAEAMLGDLDVLTLWQRLGTTEATLQTNADQAGEAYYARRAEKELDLASASSDPAEKVAHLDRAAWFATARERAARRPDVDQGQ